MDTDSLTVGLTVEQRQMVRRLEKLDRRYRAALALVERLEQERFETYMDARYLEPPLTLTQIAAASGVTQPAVSQRLRKYAAKMAEQRDGKRQRRKASVG